MRKQVDSHAEWLEARLELLAAAAADPRGGRLEQPSWPDYTAPWEYGLKA